MTIPLFDTATLRAPLHKTINERIGEVIERGTFILGPEVQAFEREFADYLGVRHVDIPCTPERVWRAVQDARAGTLPDPWREPPAAYFAS